MYKKESPTQPACLPSSPVDLVVDVVVAVLFVLGSRSLAFLE